MVPGSLSLGALGMAALTLIAVGCNGGACTLIGCSDTEHLEFPVARDVEADVSAEFCRNAVCGQAVIPVASLQAVGRFDVDITFEGPSSAEPFWLTCETSSGQASATCVVSWTLTSPERVTKGDELSVRLTLADQELASHSGVVSEIMNEYPNGEDCGVGCQSATVDVTD